MEMTSRERVLTTLWLQEPDRVPYFELGVDRVLAQKLMGWKPGTTETVASVVRNPYTLEESKQIASYLGLDIISYFLRAPTYAQTEIGVGGIAFPVDGLIKTKADLAIIDLPDPNSDELYTEAMEFAENKGDYALAFVTRIGMLQTILCLGLENFALALYDNRGLVETLLDIYFDWMTVVVENFCKIGFDLFITTDDFAYKSGMIFSPDIFRELMVPRYQQVLEKVTIPWVLHSDGNISKVVDILIDLGVSGLHPNEKGAMDIRAMKRDYGDRICLMGNVDLNILGMGSPEEVDREVWELIRDVGPGGGYILSSGNTLASYLKPECVLTMVDSVKRYGRYPIDLQ